MVLSTWRRWRTTNHSAPRPTRRHTPALEHLEPRHLLSGSVAPALIAPLTRPRSRAVDQAEAAAGRAATQADMVIQWNATLLNAIRIDRTPPPLAARTLAITQTAVFDAVKAIDPSGRLDHASAPAAAAAAADTVLDALYPAQAASFDASLTRSLAAVPAGPSRTAGLGLGRAVAQQLLAARSTDGAATEVPFTPGTAPGQ